MSVDFPGPTKPMRSTEEVFLGYLDFFRSTVAAKLDGLSEQQLRSSCLPSGWTPVELVSHLIAMERRWLVWGIEGEKVDDPWSDERDGRWYVDTGASVAELVERLYAGGRRTTTIVESHSLTDLGKPGPRWHGNAPPTLQRVLFHVLQEYARHVGHLDIVRELADGTVGE